MPTSLPRSASILQSTGAAAGACDSEVRSPWVWWHLLSLDAPTVAVVWCWFFGVAFGLHYSWTALPTLALGTWFVYVADRLLDGWRSIDTAALRDRHWFYLRHRRPFVIAWAILAVPLAYLIFFRVPLAVRNDDVILCLIGVAYFLLIHRRCVRRGNARLFSRLSHSISKELAVGFLFAISTGVPAWVRLHGDCALLLAAVALFGAICWLNCVAIQTWEDAEAEQEIMLRILSSSAPGGSGKAPNRVTPFLGAHLTGFSVAVGLLGLGLAFAAASTRASLPFAAVAASALLFLVLVRNSGRFHAQSLRIAADAALLTPLVFLLCVR